MDDKKRSVASYEEQIRALPLKKKYTREELAIPELLIEEDQTVQIYYAPHNEYFNPNAKICIVGITPGFEQMSMAFATAREGFEQGKSPEEIQADCKREARFSGSLRKNLIMQLDAIGVPEYLGISDASLLFGERDELLHTTGLISYPVFVKGKNYTGHTPKLKKNALLMKYVNERFLTEFNRFKDPGHVIVIPLGKAVEEVLLTLAEEGKIKKEQILVGFPHPSGANVNRLKELEQNKESMRKFLHSFGNDNACR